MNEFERMIVWDLRGFKSFVLRDDFEKWEGKEFDVFLIKIRSVNISL